MSNVIIYPESLCASVIGKELSAKTPTELYVAVMAEILKNRPQIIGQKETHFTTDSVRAGQYTGTTREVYINNTKVYIKTGLSTNDKWKGIGKTCQLAGLTFEVDGQAKTVTKPAPQSQIKPTVTVNNSKPADSVNLENVIDDYIEIIQLALEDVLYKSDKALEYYNNLPQNKRDCLKKYSDSRNVILSIECERINGYSSNNTDILMAELERYAQNGNRLALYYMSIWYGSGFIGVRSIRESSFSIHTTKKLYILKPDIKKANEYREDSARSGYADACYAQACYLMNKSGNDGNAVKYFEKAKKLGCKNAEIMLRYFNQPKKQVIYSYCTPFQRMGNHMPVNSATYAHYADDSYDFSDGAIYEYNNCFYYLRYNNNKSYSICKRSLGSDSEEITLHSLKGDVKYDIFCPNVTPPSDLFPLGQHSYFGIYKDRIYFREMRKIFSMNLDGEDVRQLQIPEKTAEKMYSPHAVENGIICTDFLNEKLCFYDYSTGVLKKVYPMNKLIAITDEEVYFLRNATKTTMYVYNIKNDTVSRINDVYPGLKKHTALYIDVEREIAYYIDNDSYDTTMNTVIGINRTGEIVDIWKKPHIYNKFFDASRYDGITFNGKRHIGVITEYEDKSAKKLLKIDGYGIDKDYLLSNTVLSFDRAGNAICIYRCKPDNNNNVITTTCQMLKDSVLITKFGNMGRKGYFAVPLDKTSFENELIPVCT